MAKGIKKMPPRKLRRGQKLIAVSINNQSEPQVITCGHKKDVSKPVPTSKEGLTLLATDTVVNGIESPCTFPVEVFGVVAEEIQTFPKNRHYRVFRYSKALENASSIAYAVHQKTIALKQFVLEEVPDLAKKGILTPEHMAKIKAIADNARSANDSPRVGDRVNIKTNNQQATVTHVGPMASYIYATTDKGIGLELTGADVERIL